LHGQQRQKLATLTRPSPRDSTIRNLQSAMQSYFFKLVFVAHRRLLSAATYSHRRPRTRAIQLRLCCACLAHIHAAVTVRACAINAMQRTAATELGRNNQRPFQGRTGAMRRAAALAALALSACVGLATGAVPALSTADSGRTSAFVCPPSAQVNTSCACTSGCSINSEFSYLWSSPVYPPATRWLDSGEEPWHASVGTACRACPGFS